MNTSPRFSVLIPDGESEFALPVLRCLAQMKNVKVHILSSNALSPLRFSRYTSRFLVNHHSANAEENIAAIIRAVDKTMADVILPVGLPASRLLSAFSSTMNKIIPVVSLPHSEAINTTADKWLSARWFSENQIDHPLTILYSGCEAFHKTLANIQFPVLAKPRFGCGGKGIELFHTPAEVYAFFEKHPSPESYIIQSYINGYDIDCSVLCKNGQVIASTIQKGVLYIPFKDVSWPVGLDFLEDVNIAKMVKEIVAMFNWSGIAHIDLRYDETTGLLKVIEVNPRYWASVCASAFAGINFPYIACLNALLYVTKEYKQQPKRIVGAQASLKLILNQIRSGKTAANHFDNSYLELLIKDPLPQVAGKVIQVLKGKTK